MFSGLLGHNGRTSEWKLEVGAEKFIAEADVTWLEVDCFCRSDCPQVAPPMYHRPASSSNVHSSPILRLGRYLIARNKGHMSTSDDVSHSPCACIPL